MKIVEARARITELEERIDELEALDVGELEDRLENMSIPSVEVGEVLERLGLIGSGARHDIDQVREGWTQLRYLLDRAPVPRLTR